MTYVMSDIHGNLKRFESIMEQINLQPNDTLYILGDVIDRFPYGIKIIRKIMKMPNVKMLLGNHEYMMLGAIGHCKDAADESENANWKQRRLWYRNGGAVTHEYLKHIKKEYRAEVFKYLKGLPINIDIEVNKIQYKLVHASPVENFMRLHAYYYEYDNEKEFAVWERWDETHHVPEDFTLIFGHTPTCHFQNVNPWSIWKCDDAIGIDCGGGYDYGRLACLRLDDMKEFYSEGE